MGVDCYYMPGSSPCRSILMAAKNLGVEMNLKLTNLMAGEHMTPDFLKMNITHTIPTVDDNGFYLNESRAILQYLANAYGKDDSLYPKDPKKRFLVDRMLNFDQGTLYHRFGDLYYPVMFAKAKVDPEKVKKLDESLGWLEHYLSEQAYAGGDQLTIADFAASASLATIESVGHDLSAFPKVTSYLSKVKDEIQGYQELNQQGADQFGQWYKSIVSESS